MLISVLPRSKRFIFSVLSRTFLREHLGAALLSGILGRLILISKTARATVIIATRAAIIISARTTLT
ncbi:MAG: hypothetical protein ACO32O_02455, partial [Ilumatobacteraceae bacterium]